MTPEQLKSSILQYAIQGKLVEQRAEEGTGEELYRKILVEKQRLIKDGKIKKEKILPDISEEEAPFDIPESWKWVRLGNIIQLSKGEKKENIQYKYLEARYLRGNISPKIHCEGEYVSKGTNVILVDGENSGEVFELKEEGYLGSTFKILSIPESMDRKYIINFLEYKRKELRENKKGAAIPHLNKELLFNYPLPIPPLEEQKRIVNKIEELFPYVEKYALNYEKLEKLNAGFPDNMKKSILEYAIQGKLVEQRAEEGTGEELYKKIQAEKQRLIKEGKIKKEKVLPEINDDEIPFDIPDSWKWTRWGELSFSIQYGYNAPAKTNGRIKMVRITDIQNGMINWDNVPFCDIDEKDIDKYKLAENDILFARTGGTVGKSYIVRDILEESIYAGYLIRTRYSNMLNPLYLYYFMQTNLYWNQLRAGTISTAQPNCNGQTLSKMLIPLPPIIEQQRIVSRVEELLQYINIIKQL
ncbi:hypothetical protein EHW90_07580 [Lachnoanaerobaculum orale]|uniref:Type I restriction modification DNA specificity domain-containing protein n=1 Tax=Lachnoanaerobaculum orale TaxID=979627 RepID=A0A3P3Q6W6_9FIRM|nr:restriction endonuclease subunit S [Lachnoanaerobaculum orale]RRJ16834.1 hypothetical protein EHW90_07580 [Lachnoanaerobaculum orale]